MPKKQVAGLTLIELVISIAILLLLMTLGIPSMIDYFANTSIRDVADEMQSGLQQAKFEAIHRNTQAIFSLNNSSWVITIPASGNTPAVTVASRAARGNENNILLVPAQTAVTFNGSGSTTLLSDLSVVISKPTTSNCISAGGSIRCLQVNVTKMGQIRLCDPALPNTNPRGC